MLGTAPMLRSFEPLTAPPLRSVFNPSLLSNLRVFFLLLCRVCLRSCHRCRVDFHSYTFPGCYLFTISPACADKVFPAAVKGRVADKVFPAAVKEESRDRVLLVSGDDPQASSKGQRSHSLDARMLINSNFSASLKIDIEGHQKRKNIPDGVSIKTIPPLHL